MTPAPEPKPYFCRHCNNPLGLSDDKSLAIGLVKIAQIVKLKCARCGRQMTWRPDGSNKKSIPLPISAV